MECRPVVCREWAAPVPLPYEIWEIDWRYPKGTLISSLPYFDNAECALDHELGLQDNYNHWVDRIRRDMREGGWGGYTELPYKWDADLQALVVVWELLLVGADYELDSGKPLPNDPLYWPEARGFAPAVPLSRYFFGEL